MTRFDSVWEALQYVSAVLDELRSGGVGVEVVPSKSREDKALVEKYADDPRRLASENWNHVTLKCESPEQLDLVREAQDKLLKLGISFDTGGMATERDWELDWSFTYEPK